MVNSILLWIVRRRQHRLRKQAIGEIRDMLKDRVTNVLSTISLNAQLSLTMDAQRRARIVEGVMQVDEMLDALSEETLQAWHRNYDQVSEGDDPV
jgi:hypothetical protein